MPSKFSKRLGRRGALSAKRGNANFYKGNGARNEGVHTNKGAYVVRPERLMTIVAPDLTNCELKPYVSGKHFPQGKRVPDYASMVAGAQPAAGGQAGGKDELR